jgi:hypothetical protein
MSSVVEAEGFDQEVLRAMARRVTFESLGKRQFGSRYDWSVFDPVRNILV